MYLIQVALIVLFYFNYCNCASTRVWHVHMNCGKFGFTCVPRNKTLIYECPVKTKEYHIYVNEFNGPKYMEFLIIRNCKTLTIYLKCTKSHLERKRLKYLQVSNIERLKIQDMRNYHSQLPAKVVFEDIKFIEKIPSYSFSQVDKTIKKAKCIMPAQDYNSVYFRNVTINTVNTHAFYMPNKFGNVTFTDVRINNMEASSVIVNHSEGGVFLWDKSTVQALKPFSFQIVGKRAIFSKSKFVSIPLSGINASIETFNFIDNSVKTLHSRSLSILASNVFILNNRFDSLKAGAFEQIGSRTFGKLKFTYDFSRNDINFMEPGCLHPDLIAHENVASEISFRSNRLSCACDKLDWLFSLLDHGNIAASKSAFYKMMFDERNENICSSSCNLPLAATTGMFENGNCMQNITVQWLCENKDKSTTVTTSSTLLDKTTDRIRASTIPSAKFTSTIASDNEDTNEIHIITNNKSETVPITTWFPLGTTKYIPLNAMVVEPLNNNGNYKRGASVWANNSVTSNSGVTSSLPRKGPKLKTTDFKAPTPTLSPVMSQLQISDSLKFVSSAENNYFVPLLLPLCSILCMNT